MASGAAAAVGGFFMLGLVVFLIWFFIASIVITKGQQATIIETFGKPSPRARMPGIGFRLPWPMSAIVARVDLRQKRGRRDLEVRTGDGVYVTLPVEIQYSAIRDSRRVLDAHYKAVDVDGTLMHRVLNTVRPIAADMSLDDLFKDRDRITQRVGQIMQPIFRGFGHELDTILVEEPTPPESIAEASNRIVAAEMEKQAATNLAEARRIELVGIARAEAESKRLQGEGFASQRMEVAKGLKDSMAMLREAEMSESEVSELLMDLIHYDTVTSAAQAPGNLILYPIDRNGGPLGGPIGGLEKGGRAKQDMTILAALADEISKLRDARANQKARRAAAGQNETSPPAAAERARMTAAQQEKNWREKMSGELRTAPGHRFPNSNIRPRETD